MAKQVQIRRGTTAQNAAFIGVEGEVTYDTQEKRLLTHDGATVGGVKSALKSEVDAKADPLGFTPENVANKSTSAVLGASDTLYPSQNAAKTYVDTAMAGAFAGLFGDGGDGDLVYDGAATILGVAPAANVYTLTRSVYANNMTVNNGVTIKLNGYRIFVKLTLTNAGTIQRNGNVGANGSAQFGAGGPVVLASADVGGGAGIAGLASGGNNSVSGSAQASSGTGGAGGNGGSGGAGTGGGGATGGLVNSQYTLSPFRVISPHILNGTTLLVGGAYGGGGGGGGNRGVAPGGGAGSGGGGGGIGLIFAKTIVNSGTISTLGGNGGVGAAGTATNCGGAGGGGGGGGGALFFCYHVLTNSGAISVAGGSGGSGGASGGAGGAPGSTGSGGNTGVLIKFNTTTGAFE